MSPIFTVNSPTACVRPQPTRPAMTIGYKVFAVVVASSLAVPACPPASAKPEAAQAASVDDLVSSIVHIKTFIDPNGRTVENLGREREGSGIVIDDDGLVVTIGYLMVEAHAAEIITNGGHSVPANMVG